MKNVMSKKRILVAVVITILANVILFACEHAAKKSLEKQTEAASYLNLDTRATTSKDRTSLNEVLKDRQVYFSGIEDSSVNENTVVYLENAPENEDIYMVYKIIDKETGDIYEVTDLIPAGEHVEWEPSLILPKGEHTLIFNETPYFKWDESETGYVQLTQANNEVVFTVL